MSGLWVMEKEVEITIEKQGAEITVSNNFGKKWMFPTNDVEALVCALVANTCYEYFHHYNDALEHFAMSLTVSNDVE